MQPAWQSPQPSWTVTLQPDPEGATSYQDPCPTMPGSRGPMPAKRGSSATTSAAASSAVSELAPAVGVEGGACGGEGELPPTGTLQAAKRRPTISIRLVRAAGRTSARMVG